MFKRSSLPPSDVAARIVAFSALLMCIFISIIKILQLEIIILIRDAAPLSGAIVLALTSLIIALVVYPIQKQRDRELEIKEIQTRLYSDYLQALSDDLGYTADGVYKKAPNLGTEFRYKITRLRITASLYASKRALEQMDRIANAASELNLSLEKEESINLEKVQEYIKTVSEFAYIARLDCTGVELEDISQADFVAFMPFTLNEEKMSNSK